MTIPIDSIEIPERFVSVASRWYGGQGDMLYAVCSTGCLTIGSIRPSGCDTDEKWYLRIWEDLACDVGFARSQCERDCMAWNDDYGFGDFTEQDLIDDCAVLREFEEFVDSTVERLRVAYGLEDWDAYA